MATAITSPTPNIRDENAPESKGEKLFDWVTYGGIAGLGVFLATIPVTDYLKHGGGSKGFQWCTRQLENLGMKTSSAEKAVMTSALMQGGNLGVLVVKAMENFKPQLTKKFNAMLGEPHPDDIPIDPPQSWGSLIKARIVAWGAVYASFEAAGLALGKDKFQAFEEACGRGLCKLFKKPTHIGEAIEKNETLPYRYGKIGALDVFATTAAAILLYVGSNIFARKERVEEMKHLLPAAPAPENKKEAPSPSPETPAERGPLVNASHEQKFTKSLAPASSSRGDQLLSKRQQQADAEPQLHLPG